MLAVHNAELYGSRVAHIVKGYEPIIIVLVIYWVRCCILKPMLVMSVMLTFNRNIFTNISLAILRKSGLRLDWLYPEINKSVRLFSRAHWLLGSSQCKH